MAKGDSMGRDELKKGFDLDEIEKCELQERILSVRIPDEYKTKYDVIQARSKRRFADHIRQLVVAAIDRVDLESTKAC